MVRNLTLRRHQPTPSPASATHVGALFGYDSSKERTRRKVPSSNGVSAGPKMTAFHSSRLSGHGAPLTPAGGSADRRLKSRTRRLRAGVDWASGQLSYSGQTYRRQRYRRGHRRAAVQPGSARAMSALVRAGARSSNSSRSPHHGGPRVSIGAMLLWQRDCRVSQARQSGPS